MALNLAGYKTVDRIRKWLFFTFLRQDCGWFDDPNNNVATLNTRLNVDAGSSQYVQTSFHMQSNGVGIFLFLIMICVLDYFEFLWCILSMRINYTHKYQLL